MGHRQPTSSGRAAWPLLLVAASLALLVWTWFEDAPSNPPLTASGPPATPATADHRYLEAEAPDIPAVEKTRPDEGSDLAPLPPLAAGTHDSELLRAVRASPKEYLGLVRAARLYFDLNEERWRGRKAFLAALQEHAKAGRHFLKDMPALRWLVAQGRSFHAPLTDRKWQRSNGISHAVKSPGYGAGTTLYTIKAKDLNVTFVVPQRYPKRSPIAATYPRIDPLPLLLTMHDVQGPEAKQPGQAHIRQRFGDRKIWHALFKDWLVLAPTATNGVFVDEEGRPHSDRLLSPFSRFWKHYHVDFDRVILDGTQKAFTVANSMPMFFAGVVLRGSDWTLDAEKQALVRNIEPVPIYVVDNPKLAKQIAAAGHPNVTLGPADGQLMAWMAAQRRRTPTSFVWRADRLDQVLPWWINLDSPDPKASLRFVAPTVVDTEDEPNTIRIEAAGIDTLSLFLNDEIVDLDRKVRVVVNGHLVHDRIIEITDPRIAPVTRDFDFLFDREPLLIRKSMYFGWLTPARIVDITVPPPKTGAATLPAAVAHPIRRTLSPSPSVGPTVPVGRTAEPKFVEPPTAPPLPEPPELPAADVPVETTLPDWRTWLSVLLALAAVILLARKLR